MVAANGRQGSWLVGARAAKLATKRSRSTLSRLSKLVGCGALMWGCGGSSSSSGGTDEHLGTEQAALTRPVPFRVKALNFTAFHDSDTIHEGNCGSGPVDAETTSDPNGGGCDVGWTHPGEWLEYSIQVAATGKFHIVPRVASALSGKTFRVSLDGVDLAGSVSVPSTGWQAFADRPIKDVSLSAGAHTLRVSFETGDTNLNYIDVTPGTTTLPARIDAENYQRVFESTPDNNQGNACDRGDGVDKANTSDTAGGGCHVGWATAGEWLEYDVNVVQAGSYAVTARVGSGVSGHGIRLSVDGADLGTLSTPNIGWSNFQDRTLSQVNFSAGDHVLRVLFVDGETNLNYLNITSNMPVPVVVPHRIKALNYTAFQDSDTIHEGNCGTGPVDAETTTDPTGGDCDVGHTHPGEWLEYALQVPTSGTYDLTGRVASALSGKTFRLLVDGTDVSGSRSVPSAGWQAFADRAVKDVALAAGVHMLRVSFETGDTNLNYIDVAPGTVDLPARIEAENYQRAFDSTPATNSGGACDRGDGVDKETTSDMAGGNCDVGWTTSTDWLEYDVRVAQAGAFNVAARVGSAVDGSSVVVTLDGANIGTLMVPNIGWTSFQDRTLSNVNFNAGTHTLRVSLPQGQVNLNFLNITSAPPSVPPSRAHSFGSAAAYNVFLFQDLQNTPTITGPVAVGRDISTQSFGYNTVSSGTIGVLVGRSITASGGSIHRDLVYGVSQTLTNAGVLDGVIRQASPLNFANEKTYAQGLSAGLAALTPSGATTISPDGRTIDFAGSNSTRNVFTVAGQALGATDVLSFAAPPTSTVVVNVTGSSARFETGGMQLGGLVPGHLIWNFRDADTVGLSQMGFKGTLLAPNALVSQNGVDFEGVLIAQSLYGTDNGISWAPFNGPWPIGCSTNADCGSGRTCQANACQCTTCSPACTCGSSSTCNATADCNTGLACAGGVCHTFCETNPTDPQCIPGSCVNGVKDATETDVDCGGACPACRPGGDCSAECAAKACGADPANTCGGECASLCDNGEPGCNTDFDCPGGSICGHSIGARFGFTASANVCWPAACATQAPELGGAAPEGCGTPPVCVPNCSGNRLEDGCGGYCLALQPLQQRGPGGSTFTPIPMIPRGGAFLPDPLPQQETSEVGALPGTFAVTQQGTANYTIPIEVPPGRLGLQPALALRYVGTKANGMLGLGWGLAGLSTITRCRSTKAQPPYELRPVMLDEQDRFCLDGEMLIQVNVASGKAYGADGAQYVLERDSTQLRITSHSEDGVTTGYFTALNRDGSTLSFGRNDASVVATNGVRRVWALEDVEDSAQNFMAVRYTRVRVAGVPHDVGFPEDTQADTGELLPRLISYGGSRTSAGTAAARDSSRFVYFTYAQRPDPVHHYTAGDIGFSNWRMKSIETSVNGAVVKTYRIGYEQPFTDSPAANAIHTAKKVHYVKECAPDTAVSGGEVCKPATTFAYYTEALDQSYSMPSIVYENNGTSIIDQALTVIPLDANGDGQDDLVFPTVAGLKHFRLSAWGGGSAAFAHFNVATDLSGTIPNGPNFDSGSVIDLNRDGKDDLIPLGLDQPFRVYYSDCTDTEVHWRSEQLPIPWDGGWMLKLGDFDGDGLKDLLIARFTPGEPLYRRGYELSVHRNTGVSFDAQPSDIFHSSTNRLAVFDADGDGDDDILALGSPLSVWDASTHSWKVRSGTVPVDAMVGDFNGDGLKDFFGPAQINYDPLNPPTSAGVTIWYNNGKRFEQQLVALTDPTGAALPAFSLWTGQTVVADIDGDGADDVLVRGLAGAPRAIIRLIDRAKGQVVPNPSGLPAYHVKEVPSLADLDGDGSSEIVFLHPESGEVLFSPIGGATANLLHSVQDGLGRRDSVSYDAEVLHFHATLPTRTYTPAGCMGGSLTCLHRVAPLVSNHWTDQVDPATQEVKSGAETLFNYNGAVVETGGHGWLGFGQRKIELLGLIYTTVDYHADDFRRAGLPMRVAVQRHNDSSDYSSIGTRTDVTDYQWSVWGVQNSTPDTPRFPFLLSRTDTSFSDDAYISRSQTLFSTDSFNNVEGSSTTVTTPTGLVSTTTIESPRLNDVRGHKIGLLDYVVAHSTRGGYDQERKVDLGYDDRGLLTTSTRQPEQPTTSVYQQTILTPNDFGVIDSKCVVTSAGLADQRCVSVGLDEWSIYPETVTEVGESLTTEYIYGAEAGQLLVRTEPSGVATEYGYDAFGRRNYIQGPTREGVIAYQSAAAQTTPFTEIKVWGAMRVATQFTGEGFKANTYDAFGQVVQTQLMGLDDTTVVSESLYDALGRVEVASLPHAIGSVTQGLRHYGYGSNGTLATITDPDNSTTHLTRVDSGNVLAGYADWFPDDDTVEATVVQLPRGNLKIHLRDQKGNVVRTIEDPNGLGGVGLTTHFTYGAFDLLREVATPKESTEFYPDVIGRAEAVVTTSTGLRSRVFSGFDQLVSETDANADTVSYEYDRVGRVTGELDSGGSIIAKWEYDGATGRGIGEPFREFRRSSPTSTIGTWTEHEYEDGARGRPSATKYRVGADISSPDAGGELFKVGVTYVFGVPSQIDKVSYPDNGGELVVQHAYDLGGNLRTVSKFGANGYDFWHLSQADEGLRPADELFGNGVETVRAYHRVNDGGCALDPNQSCAPGLLSNILTTSPSGAVLQNMFLSNDRNGNVTSIHEGAGPATRLFDYDGHDRLTAERLTSQGTVSTVKNYVYDGIGNMESQTGLPQYVYDDQTLRLNSIGDTQYYYDGNGNQTERIGSLVAGDYQSLDLNEFEMPWHISQGEPGAEKDVFLEYNADEQRVVKRESLAGGGEKVTVSIGGLYERVTTPNRVEHHYKIFGATGQVAEVVRDVEGEEGQVTYLHADHLGSSRILTSATGGLVEARDFEPFGKESADVDWTGTGIKSGFTGHSQDDDLGLTNMKGRLYDSTIGRFISADPVVSNPISAQGWDRYAYVENNPLAFTDPTGFVPGATPGGYPVAWDSPVGAGGSFQPVTSSTSPGPTSDARGEAAHNDAMEAAANSQSSSMNGSGPQNQSAGNGGGTMGQPSLNDPSARSMNPNTPMPVGLPNQSRSNGLAIVIAVEAPIALAPYLAAALAGVAIGHLTNEIRKNSVNLDTGALIDLTTADPASLGILVRLATKNWVVTLPALIEFARGFKRMGPIEALRAAYVLKRVTVVGATPSLRAAKLRMTGGIGLADILILGTGDFFRIPTYTTDARAVSAAAAQGVLFDAIILPPLKHTGR